MQTPQSQLRKAAGCPKKTRLESTKNVIRPILWRLNTPRLLNGRYPKLQRPTLPERSYKRVFNSDGVLDGFRRDVDERTPRDFDESDDK